MCNFGEETMGNIHVNLFKIWTSATGVDFV